MRSYLVYEKDEFPEALDTFPCAITYTLEVENNYSAGGPSIDFWRGTTEFHLFPTVSKANFPAMMLYFARIRNAAAGNVTLSGQVALFKLRAEFTPGGGVASVRGPVVLQYGSDAPHHGLVVNWQVKELVTVTVA